MTGHTPGPWLIESGGLVDGSNLAVIIETPDGRAVVALVPTEGRISRIDPGAPLVNAHLIAAAPRLVEAIRAITNLSLDTSYEALAIAHAALALVEGQERP